MQSRFEANLLRARRQVAGMEGPCQGLPTTLWANLVKSFGRQNGFDLGTKCIYKVNHTSRHAFSPDIFAILTPRLHI